MQVHWMKREHMKQLCYTARKEKNMRVCCVCEVFCLQCACGVRVRACVRGRVCVVCVV